MITLCDKPESKKPRNCDILRAENRELLAEVTRLKKSVLTDARVRRELLGLAAVTSRPPHWLIRLTTRRGCYGVPTLFMSDQHMGEVVDPAQLPNAVNAYDLEIARRRWRRTTEKAIDLCFRFLAKPQFDGAVLAFGGDGITGNIHEELLATNQADIGPVVIETGELMAWSIQQFKKAFGRVYIPCVIGNHGRMTQKLRHKNAAYTSFDWLSYQFAARFFTGDPDVIFNIPSGTDAFWRVYGHQYVMTHGAQFKGGDGLIGPLGPVTRGDHKKRSRNAQIGIPYDTMMVAHFHRLLMDSRIIMNGSLKGYDEFATDGNFGYEPPKQALFITHPEYGITFSFPVMPDEPKTTTSSEPWVSWKR